MISILIFSSINYIDCLLVVVGVCDRRPQPINVRFRLVGQRIDYIWQRMRGTNMINWQWSIETDRLKHETPKHTTGKITRSIKLASTWNTSTRVRWLCWCIHKCIIGEKCTIINVYYMKGNQLIDWNENGKQTWSWMQNVNVLFLLHT